MFPLIACLVATQVQVDQPPRLRTILPNGSAIIAEKFSGAKSIALQMFISSRGTEETSQTNGLRHLLEHMEARGPKGDLDKRLETQGAFLTAETSRDAMAFRLYLPPGKLALGLQALSELMQMPVVTPESIQREAMIMRQESALREDESKFSAAAWLQAYGELGLDPQGNLDVIRNASPEMLQKIHRIQFSSSNIAIAVVGDIDIDEASKACAELLVRAPKVDQKVQERPVVAGSATTADAKGSAFAVPVPGWRFTETAARLAAALTLASEVDHCFVIYTPSVRPGLVMIGRGDDKTRLRQAISKANPDTLFARGKNLVKLWLERQLRTPDGIASFRGLLLANGVDLKPTTLLENLNSMTLQEFKDGIEAFRSQQLVSVEGK